MTQLFKNFKDRATLHTLYKALMLACILIHSIYIFIFLMIDIKVLVYINCFSVATYIFLFFLVKKSNYIVASISTYFEVCVHSIIVTVALGWQFGFALQIIALIPISFYLPFKNHKLSYIFSFISTAVFLGLKFFTFFNLPICNNLENGFYERILYILNSFVCVIPMVIFAGIYSSYVKKSQNILSSQNKDLLQLASLDPLTGLLNRRSMVAKLELAYLDREKYRKNFSLCICDIDDFKKVNDIYGHDCGDYVLKSLAKILRTNLSEECSICRWGGEEILILLPDTNCDNGQSTIENLRQIIQKTDLKYDNKKINITLTFGVTCGDEYTSISDMLLQADRNLYKGKNSGKNCVIIDY